MKRAAWFAIVFLSLGVSAYAVIAYGALAPGALVHPDMRAGFEAQAWPLRLHIFAAVVALALGPFQFSARLRARKPRLHRLMGQAYLGIGVGLGGLAGLYMAQFAYGGAAARLGFGVLALAWLYSGWRAYAAIRGGDVALHRAWMVRNFALTFGAVTFRFYLPLFIVSGAGFESAYAAAAWACWVPNLILAQLWLASGRPAVARGIKAVRAPMAR